MKYRVIRHAWNKEQEDHKYIARVELPKRPGMKYNNYRYFYDRPTYEAYLKNQTTAQKTNGLNNLVNNLFLNRNTAVSANTINNGQNVIQNMFNIAKTEAAEVVNEVKDKTVEIQNNGAKFANTYLSQNGDTKIGDTEEPKITVKEFVSIAINSGIGNAVGTVVANVVSKLLEKKDEAEEWFDTITEPEEPKEELVKPTTFDELPRKTQNYTKDEDMALINPNYETYEWEYTNNCSYCTTAYEFRQRGYDVEVAPISIDDDPTYTTELASWFEGAETRGYMDIVQDNDPLWMLRKDDITDVAAHSDLIIKELESHGEGARGNFCVAWKDSNSGHSIVWEVENGEVVFRDCQTNRKIENNEIKDYLARTSYVEYFRTDNLEFSEEALKTIRYKRKGES